MIYEFASTSAVPVRNGSPLYGVAISIVFLGALLAVIDGVNSCAGTNDYDFMGHVVTGVFAGALFIVTGTIGIFAYLEESAEVSSNYYTAFLVLSSISAIVCFVLVVLNVLNFGAPLMAGLIYSNAKTGLKSLCAVRSVTLLIYFLLFIIFVVAAVSSSKFR